MTEGVGLRTPPSDPFAATVFPPVPHGVHWSLDRPRALLRALADPHLRYPCLHVGGTNGKGSVGSFWASVLRASGLHVGLYTSPHLCSFRERIQVDGRPISEEAVDEGAAAMADLIERHRPSFFEASTVLAFHHFAAENVDVAVIEVGLGGRLDATNVIRPVVAAVTNIALDHADYLGDTLEQIALEKAGIVKSGVPFITAEQDPRLLDILKSVCDERGAPFHRLDEDADIRDIELARDHTVVTVPTATWGDLRLHIPLLGRHQAVNAALAARSLELIPPGLMPDRDAVLEGSGSVRWPGRVQVERENDRTWVFDVAHNTAGVHALAEALPHLALDRPIVVLVGILGDKDWREMLPPLFALADHAILTEPPSAPGERRWNPREAAASLGSEAPMSVIEDFGEALEAAARLATPGTVVVTGSCHTVGDALCTLGMEPFQA